MLSAAGWFELASLEISGDAATIRAAAIDGDGRVRPGWMRIDTPVMVRRVAGAFREQSDSASPDSRRLCGSLRG